VFTSISLNFTFYANWCNLTSFDKTYHSRRAQTGFCRFLRVFSGVFHRRKWCQIFGSRDLEIWTPGILAYRDFDPLGILTMVKSSDPPKSGFWGLAIRDLVCFTSGRSEIHGLKTWIQSVSRPASLKSWVWRPGFSIFHV